MKLKLIENYTGLYYFTDQGKIFSCDRKVIRNRTGRKTHYLTIKGKELRPWINHQGYPCVSLCKNGKINKLRMNRLIATAFIPNPLNLPIVKHLDNNPLNNHISNLEWGTHSSNSRQAYSEGRMKNLFKPETTLGENNFHAKLNKEKVLEIINSSLSARELAKQYNISTTQIYYILTRKSWKHI